MPLVEVSLVRGRDPETIHDLIHALHDAVEASIGAPSASIRVIVREVPATHWAVGRVTKDELAVQDPARSDLPPTEAEP